MAFEAFRAQSQAPARAGRKSTWYAVSIAFHGALIAAGIAYSFWHIEELTAPSLKVTFMSAAPPPPPAAPPPAGGGTGAKKPKIQVKKPVIQQRPDLVQPRETVKQEPPKEEPKQDDHGEKGGEKGGIVGGTPGGKAGGTPGGTPGGTAGGVPGSQGAAAKFVAPNIGQGLKISGEKGDMPIPLRKPGALYQVLVKVCVSMSGSVDRVTIMKASDPLADAEALRVVKTFRYRPFLVNGTPAPFCYPYMVEFKTE
jgi:TonB family protein